MSARHVHHKVCFSREQLLSILKVLIESLAEPAFVAQLSNLAPDEDKMDELINSTQLDLVRQHLPGIPPQAVLGDFAKATSAFPGDGEVMAALANISLAEERAVSAALRKEVPADPLIQISPQIMLQVAEQLAKNPDAFKKQQEMLQMMYGSTEAMDKLKEHMKGLETSNPQAYAVFSQTLAATALFTPEHEHSHPPGGHKSASAGSGAAPADDPDMPPLQDLDDDLEDNMV